MSPKPEKTLLLFTTGFPYGKGEQFIETEIHFLSRVFKDIHIFPEKISGEARPLPSNVKVIAFEPAPLTQVRPLVMKHGMDLLGIFSYEILNSKERGRYLKQPAWNMNLLIGNYHTALELEKVLEQYDMASTVVYSYWFKDWASKLAIIKHRKNLKFELITRILGYDFDVKQNPLGYFPFRSFEMNEVSRIYPITNYGKNYIKKHYPAYKGGLKVSHLSVYDHGWNESRQKDYFQICSCGFLVPLKRMGLMPEILKHLDFKVVWTHFGNGPEEEMIRQKASELPVNITFDYKGYTPNKDVIRFYKENPVDLFIHLSEMEGGAPVAIQEACSFGVPAIGADADGTPEIVNEQTGWLIPKDFDPKEVAKIIRDYHEDKGDKTAFRKGVKAYWNSEFNAEFVYRDFAHELAGSQKSVILEKA
ncbi:MAG: glycosyltransferase [Bacteroidia bacterium]|nr:glycosyltransferase [Bacteroidia bacterium]